MKEIIFFGMLILFMIVFVVGNYRKSKTIGERILLIIYFLVYSVPIIFFYMDLWNIPSKFNLTAGIDSQRWLDNIFNYITTIIATIIGAGVSIGLALYQIDRNNKDNEKRDKENLRIQNLPILKYSITSKKNVPSELENLIITNIENGTPYNFNFSMKNIGMNGIKNIKVKLEPDFVSATAQRFFGYDSLEIMEKGEEIEINKFFSLKSSEIPYKIVAIVSYEDVLSNCYVQKIEINYTATERVNCGIHEGRIEYCVGKEELIENVK